MAFTYYFQACKLKTSFPRDLTLHNSSWKMKDHKNRRSGWQSDPMGKGAKSCKPTDKASQAVYNLKTNSCRQLVGIPCQFTVLCGSDPVFLGSTFLSDAIETYFKNNNNVTLK